MVSVGILGFCFAMLNSGLFFLSLVLDFPMVWSRHIEDLGCFLMAVSQVIIF